MSTLSERAQRHAALGDPTRLAIVDQLAVTDRSPKELADRFGVPSNLLAHHLDVLEDAGLVERFGSCGDRRRRYVRLRQDSLSTLRPVAEAHRGAVLFVCTHNSARSQLAAALWRSRTGCEATSAGTHPAESVHPGAVAAARRAGLDLGAATPRHIDAVEATDLVVTVCDRAHEELAPPDSWWHWSIHDPVEAGTADAFDATLARLDTRIQTLTGRP